AVIARAAVERTLTSLPAHVGDVVPAVALEVDSRHIVPGVDEDVRIRTALEAEPGDGTVVAAVVDHGVGTRGTAAVHVDRADALAIVGEADAAGGRRRDAAGASTPASDCAPLPVEEPGNAAFQHDGEDNRAVIDDRQRVRRFVRIAQPEVIPQA